MNITKERFLNDVKDHRLTIVKDDGVYRHLQFSRPDTICYAFDIITWPGHLCYTGDMGTFVFSRINDMFRFFRDSSGAMTIGTDYWAEKCLAEDIPDGIREFSEDKYRRTVVEWMNQLINDRAEAHTPDGNELFAKELKACVDDELLNVDDLSDESAHRLMHDFKFTFNYEDYEIRDSWEYSLTAKTPRFIWCCYALVWGIGKYDEAKLGDACKQ